MNRKVKLVTLLLYMHFHTRCDSSEQKQDSKEVTLRDKIKEIKYGVENEGTTHDYLIDLDEINQYGTLTEKPIAQQGSKKKRVYKKRITRATIKPRKKFNGTIEKTRKPYTRKVINKLNRMFFYGTMKKGEPEHYWLKDNFNGESTFITEGLTTLKYPLVILGEYNIPTVLNYRGLGHQIFGEVYELDDIMFDKLDDIEGAVHAKVRIEEDILYVTESGKEKKMPCWMYVKWFYSGKLNASQFLNNYHSKGSHGLMFKNWNVTRSKHYTT
uniref:Gamma-glutamylcyclotransferase family protein n=1 Tax=Clastoptera arizonana TaxID=38151 RepID=A0A1B6C236_9HEMI